MDNPLANLKVDTWYKAVVAVAAVALVASITVSNNPAATFALGFLFIGFGEWKNHPERSTIVPPTAFTPAGILTSTARNPSILGLILDGIGAIVITIGAYRSL